MIMAKFLDNLNESLLNYKKMNDYIIEIGVVEAKTGRKQFLSIGLTNAEILYINEHGSPVNRMPPRPILHMTLRWAQKSKLIEKTLQRCSQGVLEENWKEAEIEKELTKMCMRMENYCKDLIMLNDGRLAANAPSVAKRKGGNHPLFDTGQLAGSITCRWRKRSNIS